MPREQPYVSKSRKLTPYENEVLAILAEECSEVIKEVTKIMRFGPDDINPNTGEVNIVSLANEIGDLYAMLNRVTVDFNLSRSGIQQAVTAKEKRIEIYMQEKRI